MQALSLKFVGIVLAAAVSLCLGAPRDAEARDCSSQDCRPPPKNAHFELRNPNVTRWRWLEDTYWTVPNSNLPAVLFDAENDVVIPTSDQTVYHITGFRDGYFWGKNVAQLKVPFPGDAPVACYSLVGAVTPQGRLLLSFITVGEDDVASQQQGFGEMIEVRGQWTMQNLTTSPSFAHWAYMVQSKPGDASWSDLPGAGMSVPDFLALCPGDGPQPPTD